MSARTTLLAAALCAVAIPSAASAQSAPNAPPKYLLIAEENVKPGKATAHEKNEAAWATEYAKSGSTAHYIAMNPMTGGTATMYVGGYGTWAEVAAAQDALGKVPGLQQKIDALAEKDGDFLNGVRVTWAAFQPDVSIGTPAEIARAHGWRVSTYRVKIGHTDEFMEARKMLKASYDKAGVDPHIGLYAVTQGANVPTYITFRPFTSLAQFDGDSAMNAATRAQVPADSMKKYDKLLESSLITRETNTYLVSPKSSYVRAEFADADKFWNDSPTVVAANAKKGGAIQAGAPRSAKAKKQ